MNQTSTIPSEDTGLIYAVLKLSFSKQCKIYSFNPLCHRARPMVNSMKTSYAQQKSIVATPSVNRRPNADTFLPVKPT